MKCPHCTQECNALVLETRKQDDAIIRRRACGKCGKAFYSREVPDLTIVLRSTRTNKPGRFARVEPGPKSTNLDAFTVWR